MRNLTPQHRLSLTALAAFTALYATPAFAQATEPAPPVIEAPAPVISAPAPTEAATAPTPAPAAAVLHVEPQTAPARAATTATRVARAAPVTTAPAPKPVLREAAAPIAAAPVMTPTPTPTVKPAPAAALVARSEVTRGTITTGDDYTAEIAGGALALLVLGGGAFAFSRRKRHEERDDYVVETAYVAPPAVAPMAMPIARPAPAMAEARLPSGFDLSRFGPHTQAAYRGPSEDNPSHSLRRRLRRAAFFDQRAREATAGDYATAPLAAQPAVARRVEREDQIVVRPAPVRAGHFRYQPVRQA